MAVYGGPDIVTSGLVLCLDAANSKSYPGTGTVWNDLSGSNNNGTLTNGPTYNSNNGGSIVFDGTNDYINTNYDLSWNNTNSVSIFLYLKPNSLSLTYPFIGKGDYEWQMRQAGTSLTFVYWNTTGTHTNGPVTTITNFFTDTTNFVHIALVWSHLNNQYYLYRNSQLTNTINWTDASINRNSAESMKIGGAIYLWGANSSYWNGMMATTHIYNRALSANEVSQNYNAIKGRFAL